ncbi:uncharacterized protein METZ01_LOCUS178781, partial [marine metagenome]
VKNQTDPKKFNKIEEVIKDFFLFYYCPASIRQAQLKKTFIIICTLNKQKKVKSINYIG